MMYHWIYIILTGNFYWLLRYLYLSDIMNWIINQLSYIKVNLYWINLWLIPDARFDIILPHSLTFTTMVKVQKIFYVEIYFYLNWWCRKCWRQAPNENDQSHHYQEIQLIIMVDIFYEMVETWLVFGMGRRGWGAWVKRIPNCHSSFHFWITSHSLSPSRQYKPLIFQSSFIFQVIHIILMGPYREDILECP